MGSGPSRSTTRVCQLNSRTQPNNNSSTWSFVSIATDGLCPRRNSDSPLRSIDRRPEYQKKEDREKIVQRAITAETRVKESESRMKDLEKQVHDLSIANADLRNKLAWSMENTKNANTLDYGFVHHSLSESTAQLNEKDHEIELLNQKLSEAQESLDHLGASEAIKDLKIVEQQREIESLQLRITSLEAPSLSPQMSSIDQPRKSNIRSISAQVRRLSPNHSNKLRPVSMQPEHIRKNIVVIERQRKTEEVARNSIDSDADIQEILNTPIRTSPSAFYHKRNSDVGDPTRPKPTFQ